jgi:hypothetical protein
MKKQSHQFFLADNPFEINDEDIFIYSALKGERALLKVNMIEIEELFGTPFPENTHTIYYAPSQTGEPEFHHISIIDNIDIPEKNISLFLMEAGLWFKSLLINEDKQIQKDMKTKAVEPVLKDFNSTTKGLKIIHDQTEKKWMAIFNDSIKVFDSEEHTDDWLINEMNIEEDLLDKGCINEIE